MPQEQVAGLVQGAVTGIGSLPHADTTAAIEFVFASAPDLPYIPQLRAVEPSDSMVVQGLLGVRGVEFVVGHGLVVDPIVLHPLAKVVPNLDHRAYHAFHAFLDAVPGHTGPIKWQFAGPLTLGMVLMRHGVPARTAFDVAVRAVRVTTRAIYRLIRDACPEALQVVVLDEPSASAVLCPGFPVPPDAAIDLVSGALAGLELSAKVGVHCCAEADSSALLAAGPSVLSLPIHDRIFPGVAMLSRFLDYGGVVAWGVVPTDRPVSFGADRYWRDLAGHWARLVEYGFDPEVLRRQSLVTPACGLDSHTVEQAEHVFSLCREISERIAGADDFPRRLVSRR